MAGTGRLTHRVLVHVAGISVRWLASKKSIQKHGNLVTCLANLHGILSIASPIIVRPLAAAHNHPRRAMLEAFAGLDSTTQITIVRFAG